MWEVSRGGESSFKLNSSAKCPQFLTWLEIERSSCKCKLKHRLDKTWSRTRLSMSVLGQFCSDRDRRHNLGHVSDGSWVFQGQNFRDELYFVSFTIWGMQQRELEPSLIGFYLLFWIWYQEHGWLNRNKSRKLLWDQVFSQGLEFQCHCVELYLQVVEYLTLLFKAMVLTVVLSSSGEKKILVLVHLDVCPAVQHWQC